MIGLNEVTRVLAIVAKDDLFEPITKLYFAYHPTPFSNKVLRTEAEARTCLNARIQCIRDEGMLR